MQLAGFGALIAEKLDKGDANPPQVPGNRPYREWAGMPVVPMAGDACVKCGECANVCPAQAIPLENPSQTDKTRCITCMRCVMVCPVKARALPAQVQDMLAQKLAPFVHKHPENELYL